MSSEYDGVISGQSPRQTELYDSLLATLVELGHQQRPEVKDLQSVNTQLPPAENGVWVRWNIRKLNVSVDD